MNNYGRYGGGGSGSADRRKEKANEKSNEKENAWNAEDGHGAPWIRGLCGLWCWPSTSGLGVNTVASDARPTQRCGWSG